MNIIETPVAKDLSSVISKTEQPLHCVSFKDLAHNITEALIKKIYGPQERIAQGYFRLKHVTEGLDEVAAKQAAQAELDFQINQLCAHLDDPDMYAIGYSSNVACGHQTSSMPDDFKPIGIFGFRALRNHPKGQKLIESLQAKNLLALPAEKYALAHAFSALNDHRGLEVLKYAFTIMGLKAMEAGYEDIFFFMSDHRLKDIYRRYGLDFPDDFKFEDSSHLIGHYPLNDKHKTRVLAHAQSLGLVD